MIRMTVRRAGLVCAAAMGAALAGCTGCTVGYTADVHNTTAQPIGVALMRADASGQPGVLATQRLGPGNRAQISRYGISDNLKVYLEVDAQGNPGYPAQMDLLPGLTVVKVTQDGNLPTGKLHVEQIARD